MRAQCWKPSTLVEGGFTGLSMDGRKSRLEEYVEENLCEAIIQSMKKEDIPLYRFGMPDAYNAMRLLTDQLFESR